MSTKALTILAVVLALLGIFMVHQYVKANVKPPEPTVEVFVAALDIPAGTDLSRPGSLFARYAVPKKYAKPYFVWDSDEAYLADQKLRRPMARGEFLTPAHLVSADTKRIADRLQADERAVTITIRGVNVRRFLSPGNRIDILATTSTKNDRATRVLLKDVEVLAVGSHAEETFRDTELERVTGAGEVTVRVKALQARKLAHAVTTGYILHATLRMTATASKSAKDDDGPDIKDGNLFGE